jgi:hypothetical protein
MKVSAGFFAAGAAAAAIGSGSSQDAKNIEHIFDYATANGMLYSPSRSCPVRLARTQSN